MISLRLRNGIVCRCCGSKILKPEDIGESKNGHICKKCMDKLDKEGILVYQPRIRIGRKRGYPSGKAKQTVQVKIPTKFRKESLKWKCKLCGTPVPVGFRTKHLREVHPELLHAKGKDYFVLNETL